MTTTEALRLEETAPRDNLLRSANFELIRATSEDDGLTMEGYAAVFGSPTLIDSWEGRFTELIAPGAFKKTLRERTPVLMFDHGQHPLIGSMPLGSVQDAREDSKGLYVKARLTDNWLIQPVRDAIAEGSVTGMSFRFSVVKDAWERPADADPIRTLREVKVPELGPVVFPAYESTSVGVRAREVAGLLADPEFREHLARALLLGTSQEAARDEGTSEDAAAPTEPDDSTPRITNKERRLRAAYLRGVATS